MQVTIYDVAKQAGVSIATVSKVINQTGRISTQTREKVSRVMQELDYYPSAVASALTAKKTYTLGLLLPDLANPFFAEMARSVEDQAHEFGFNVMICSTDNNTEREERNLSFLKQKRVDGIIIIATGVQNDAVIRHLKKQSIPIVLLSRDLPSIAIDTVLVDDFLGGHMATTHLIELGHQRIGIIMEDTIISSSRERMRGYQSALEEAGLPFDKELVRVSDMGMGSTRNAAKSLLDSPAAPTAIFALNEFIATGVIQIAREKELVLPRDLSIIGFDNTILATTMNPPLTTVAQPIQEMGKKAVDMIIHTIENDHTTKQRVVMHPELVIRSSVSAPRDSK